MNIKPEPDDEQAKRRKLNEQSSSASAKAKSSKDVPADKDKHCPTCKRSWRANDPLAPTDGVCDRMQCDSQTLLPGIHGEAVPESARQVVNKTDQ